MTEHPSIRTQILIFALYGEYVLPWVECVWTNNLLTLLKELGVRERAARSTLSRMSKKGWIESERIGRYSRYSLTTRGRTIVREAQSRIYEPRPRKWDGKWLMVVYSIPEEMRTVRSNLRTRLGWLGFGNLAPGTWISPNDVGPEVEEDLKDLGVSPFVVRFSGLELEMASPAEIVERCWDLESINQDYRKFVAKFDPVFQGLCRSLDSGEELDRAECFRQRIWLTLEFTQFPRRDPNLPGDLLPEGWLGTRASELYNQLHQCLKEPADGYVAEVLSANPNRERSNSPEARLNA